MAGRLANALRSLWAKEPVIAASFGIAAVALLSPLLSPYTKYSGMINQATPYTYPVPVRDDGSVPDVPSQPWDKKGPNLQWLKDL